MIQGGDNSIRDRIKSDVLQEVQRILLSYEERIATLEKENRLLWEENRTLYSALGDLVLFIDDFEEEIKAKLLSLKYMTQNQGYNITLLTNLFPSSFDTYGTSITYLSYTPVGRMPLKTQEIIDTNSSIFLSKYYNKLSEVMSELGDLYANSEDISLEKLSNDYKAMKTDAKDFSKLVNKEWDQYDLLLNSSSRTIAGIGLNVLDPDAVVNGGFEQGSSYWTLYGDGAHQVVTEPPYQVWSGEKSLYVGGSLVADSWDGAYQLVYIPPNADEVELSWMYSLWTEDNYDYDKFEIYIAPYGSSPERIFATGSGYNRGEPLITDFQSFSYNLDGYSDVSLYIYVGVSNGVDSNYYTLAFVDNVAVTYVERSCDWYCFANCAQQNYVDLESLCGYMYYYCGLAPSDINPFCWALLICAGYLIPGCVSYCCQ